MAISRHISFPVVQHQRRNAGRTQRRPVSQNRRFTWFARALGRAVRIARSIQIPTLYDLVAAVHPRTRKAFIVGSSLLGLLLMSYLYIASPNGYLARAKLQALIDDKNAEIAYLKQQQVQLKREISLLQSDTLTIERLARNELNMAYPGESIYRLTSESPPAYVMDWSYSRTRTPQ